MQATKFNIYGRIASFFQTSNLTSLLVTIALLLGIFSIFITPREEEPQIEVTILFASINYYDPYLFNYYRSNVWTCFIKSTIYSYFYDIGMITLSGIIIRNSILLIDCAQKKKDEVSIKTAIIDFSINRAQPIILTGFSAILGGGFILNDPIFNGLAISLIFGIFVSTLLTLVVIPLLYFLALTKLKVT